MKFSGVAKRIDDIDLPRIGYSIGVGEDEIHAVLDVEALGIGFDSQKRVKALFEKHVFYRELEGEERDRAVAEGLAHKNWRRDYPKDSYPRLKRAMAINATAALRACSWGLGQIMGFNHKLAGYPTVQAMVTDFSKDEENQLQAMINFIVNAGLDDELRAHNWVGFARGYNGAGFAKNAYDKKLAASFRRWQKIPDTPFEPTNDNKPVRRAGMLRIGMRSDAVRTWQEFLNKVGYGGSVAVDGQFGPATEKATKSLQVKLGVTPDGLVGPNTMAAAITYMEQLEQETIERSKTVFHKQESRIEEAAGRLEDADDLMAELNKPPLQSKTIWGAVKSYGGNITGALTSYMVSLGTWFAGLPLWAQLLIAAVIIISFGFGIYGAVQVIRERLKYNREAGRLLARPITNWVLQNVQ